MNFRLTAPFHFFGIVNSAPSPTLYVSAKLRWFMPIDSRPRESM
jgi:hypothetical protein